MILGVLRRRAERAERRRWKPLQDWASQNGWVLALRPRPDWYQRLPGRDPNGVVLALSGTVRGQPVTVADYSHAQVPPGVGHEYPAQVLRLVGVVVRLERWYPSIEVQSRGARFRLHSRLFGHSSTAADDSPWDHRFDRRFKVVTDDPGVVRSLIGRQLIAAHLAGAVPTWSLTGRELLTYRSGSIIHEPSRVPAMAERLIRVADLLGC